MNGSRTGIICAILSLALLAGGCAASGTQAPPAAPRPSPEVAAEYEALYRARQDSARARHTPADVQFMTHMIHHHAQALEMSRLVPERTENAQIRTLAARIINAQRDEIEIMSRWLRDRSHPVPEVPERTETVSHTDSHGAPHADHAMAEMPGMLTAAEIDLLRQARGPAFDRLFLESMIRHHEGAVIMVEELFATDGAAQDEEAFRFASDAQVDQATEVARMRSMLERMPVPAPER